MKRLINPRVSLIAAVAVAIGIFAFYEMLFGELWFGLVAAAVLVALVIVCLIKRRGARFAVIALLFLLFGFGRSWLYYALHNSNEIHLETLTVTGRVTDLGRNKDVTSSCYYLDDCRDDDGKLRGVVRVVLNGAELSVGDVITVSGEVSSVYPVKATVNSFEVRHNVRYEVQSATLLTSVRGRIRLDERIRMYIYDVTQEYMPHNGGVMYALLTGDRSAVADSEDWSFTRAGVVHLLAVSGLHVGFIATVLTWLFRKLNMWLQYTLTFIPLLFYAFICSFSPSVTRALIMLACSMLTKMLFAQYDMMTSIGWAALITLTICPFYMFDAGFQLSFMAVFGVATLHMALRSRWLRRDVNKHLRHLYETLTVSLCCIASTLFVLAVQDREVALFGVLLNLIAVPMVSVTLVLGLVGLLPWVFHWLLYGADILLQFVVRLAELTSGINFATVSFEALPLSVIVAAVLLFALGGYIDLNKLGKRVFYPICCFLLVLTVVLAYVPKKSRDLAYVVQTQYGSVLAVTSSSGEVAVVGNFHDYATVYQAVSHIDSYRTKRAALYIAHVSQADTSAVECALKRLDVQEAFLLDTESNDEVTGLLASRGVEVVRQYANTEMGGDIAVRSLYDATLAAAYVRVGELGLCMIFDESKLASVIDMQPAAEFYLMDRAVPLADGKITMLTPYQSDIAHNLGANRYGNFTILQKGDKITINYR